MALLSMNDVKLSFGGPPLFDGVNLQIEENERVCLLGRNGAGKSTLMKVIRGDIAVDSGKIARQQSLRVAYLTQEVPNRLDDTVSDVVEEALSDGAGWEGQQQVERLLSQMKLNGASLFKNLSAGMKRRVLLARGIATDPHILLLDEPTNHLDIDSIAWLEDFLLRYKGSIFFVTHDRTFLQKLATRIVELDRGCLGSWNCDYNTYLERKESLLEEEAAQRAKFDKKLSDEEVWIRKGIKARRTRNEGRVRALVKMRRELQDRRQHMGEVKMSLQQGKLSGKLVIEAENLSCGYDGNVVVKDFSTIIMRGDKVGIIGPNGAGKTTLLKTLLHKMEPLSGTLKLGTKLEVAYFDQLRSQLEEEKSVQDNVGEGNDHVILNGKSRHIIGYLQDFLFTPDRARSPVKILSGGERNRLLLAKLFTKPSNVIVMDEPTNDLDMETLDLLEEVLSEYKGTLLLVSHDRSFINNIVTSTIVFEGVGRVEEYVGGYDDWLRQRKVEIKENQKKTGAKQKQERPRKLSFRENKELQELPEKIEKLEEKKEELYQFMTDPEIYRNSDRISEIKADIENIEKSLEEDYKRWEELEELRVSIEGGA
ncbi:MAG: ATP-binding cassette domain-containing protein [Deltaproteobacteria bacterium]|nr:ATP-binding cassette domain-containing protein [Deltaproteobacteria bacterium]